MKKNLLIFALLLLITGQLMSQQAVPQSIESVLDARNELYFKFSYNTESELSALTNVISIDGVYGNDVYAYANKNEFIQFLGFNLPYTVLQAPSLIHTALMKDDIDIKSINVWDFYPTYGGYESMMYQFETNYPNLCKVYNLGTLNSGRKILAAKITGNVNQPGNKPRFNYSSSMHGDELTGYVLMLRLIDYLLSNYGSIPRITNLVNNIEIWITPLENPDGAYTNDNSTVNGATRNNANGVDLNRNYKNPVSGNHPDGNPWQQETIITMGYADSMNFTMSANFHGGIECVNYPWDSWVSSVKTHADNSWWQFVSREYADTARFYSPSNYMNPSGSSFFNGVTHGGDWYVVRGSRQDYFNYYTFTREFTLEISNTKLPPASTLPNYWNYNYRSILNYLEQCLYGLRGVVIDSCTGAPIKAQIFISGHDLDNSHVYTFMPLGNYHRPLLSGNYTISISAPGYQSKTFNNILVTNYNTTILNVALAPHAPQASISSNLLYTCNGHINFAANIDNADSWVWHFGDGSSSIQQNPTHVYNLAGIYYPYLSLNNCTGTLQIPLGDSIVVDLPQVPTASDVNLCAPASVSLTASGTGTVQWFANASDTMPLDTGNVFVTPVINQSTQYYVNQLTETLANVGETNATSNGGMFVSATPHYLVFDCFNPVRLVSVLVNASTAGNRTVYLASHTNQIIDSVEVFINVGVSRVTLDLDIPAGNNLRLVGPPSPNLYRSNAGLNYPYEISSYLSIKSSSASTNPTGYYYYFYDWEVVLGSCESAKVPVAVNLNLPPQAAFDYVVFDLQVSFDNMSVGGLQYHWNFGDGQTSLLETPTHTFSSYGTYTVELIVTNDCGSDTTSMQLHLSNLAPAADFTANHTHVSEGAFVQFTDISNNNPNSWQWAFEGGTPAFSTQKNPLIQYNFSGTYKVSLLVANNFGNDSITKLDFIDVFDAGLAPVANFSASQTNIFAGDSIQFTDLSTFAPNAWLWNFEGGTPSASALQNPTVIYNAPGIYFVTLVASNNYGTGFESKSNYIHVEPASVYTFPEGEAQLLVYPNPAQNELFLHLYNNNEKIFNIDITDVVGRKVFVDIDCDCSHSLYCRINLIGLSEGSYWLSLTNSRKRYMAKFVVVK